MCSPQLIGPGRTRCAWNTPSRHSDWHSAGGGSIPCSRFEHSSAAGRPSSFGTAGTETAIAAAVAPGAGSPRFQIGNRDGRLLYESELDGERGAGRVSSAGKMVSLAQPFFWSLGRSAALGGNGSSTRCAAAAWWRNTRAAFTRYRGRNRQPVLTAIAARWKQSGGVADSGGRFRQVQQIVQSASSCAGCLRAQYRRERGDLSHHLAVDLRSSEVIAPRNL